MSEVRVNNLSNENNTGGPTISGITTYSSSHFFVPPQGDTASRPSDCEPGSLRFNTDSAHLEYFRGNTIGWVEIEAELTAPLGGGTGSNAGLGDRGVVFGGHTSGIVNTMEFITISTLGNSQDFGDLATAASRGGSLSSRTRGLRGGGRTPSAINTIEFITISSTGDATNFGDLNYTPTFPAPMANQTRGIWAGGYVPSNFDTIDYVTIATTGDAQDFGDLTTACNNHSTGGASTGHGGL